MDGKMYFQQKLNVEKAKTSFIQDYRGRGRSRSSERDRGRKDLRRRSSRRDSSSSDESRERHRSKKSKKGYVIVSSYLDLHQKEENIKNIEDIVILQIVVRRKEEGRSIEEEAQVHLLIDAQKSKES
jgi:hypothetical protein